MFNKIVRISYQFATHNKFCILGAGTGGINTASHLLRQKNIRGSDIRIFDPSPYHYYQPGWTMVGNNLTSSENTRKPMEKMIPEGTLWTKQKIVKIQPEKNKITTDQGREFTYDHLILSTGFKNDWHKIKGLKELLDDPKSKVCSIYDYEYSKKTGRLGYNFKGGKAIFTQPPMPIKCAGAPQKILYLWTDLWQKNKINADVEFVKNAAVMFGVPKYSESLAKIAKGYHITTTFKYNLVELTGSQAIFENIDTKEKVTKQYDFIHVVPPMSPHEFLKESGIANEAGFVDVDKNTLRHTKFSNIWALGDCSSLPNSKTAAAIFSQTQALIKNIVEVLNHPKTTDLPGKYDGYSSCPLFVGNKKLMLAEFKYDGVVDQTFYKDQQKPRKVFYYMKKYLFPFMYWKVMPRGLWNGKKGIKWGP